MGARLDRPPLGSTLIGALAIQSAVSVQRLRSTVLAAAAVLALFVPVVRFTPARFAHGETPRPSLEINVYVNAHKRSVALRANFEALSKSIRREPPAGGVVSPEALGLFREHKREYFDLRETLFQIAFLHSSAIVERPPARDLKKNLLKTSLSLMAGTDLVGNFQAVAITLSEYPALRDAWNEADVARGIPEGSWEISLNAYHQASYHELFKEALEKLKRYRRLLESYRESHDMEIFAVYPQGIDASLQEAEQSYALVRARFADEDLGQDEQDVRALVERSKTLRSAWAIAAPALREAIARDRGLIRGHVHLQIHEAKRDYLDLRESLYPLAFKHVAKLTRPDIPYPPSFRMRAVGISLLAAVTLYENAHLAQSHFIAIPGVRALLNQGDPALGVPRKFWDYVEKEFLRPEYRALLEAGIRMMEQADDLRNDPLLTYLGQEMSASAGLPEILGEGLSIQVARALRHYLGRLNAIGMGVPKEGKLQFSKGFGNLVGMVEFRRGKLFNQPGWAQFVKERLKPGDLLLEKTPFRLTDKFIPGHFGHVALYVGTEKQLHELGLLNDPFVTRHVKQVADGRTIVEALREGTQINTVERFLNIDDLAILRPKEGVIPRVHIRQAIALAFSHIGKKYDFAFDNNTWDAIVCSELAFQTYVNVRWNFAKVLTSYTISPDDVAVFGGSDLSRPFDLVTFIHDGRVVHDRMTGMRNEELYIKLLGKRYTGAAR